MASEKGKDSFAALFEAAATHRRRPRPKQGDRLDVQVIAIGKDTIFVDVGDRLEGVFDRATVESSDGVVPFEVGSTVTVMIEDTRGDQVRVTPLFVRTSHASSVETEEGVVQIPVARATPLLVEGATVRGTIVSVERYGLFVQIEGTQGRAGRGLVPTQETLAPRGADLKKQYPVGTPLEAKIVAIQEDGKIRLSMKGAQQDAERAEFQKFASGDKQATTEKPGVVRGFGTLGDLLKGSKPSR